MSSPGTDIRHRYAAAMLGDLYEPDEITERATYGGRVFPAVDRILAVRDEELDRLREENAYCLEAFKGAENRRQMWRERAETAEATLARVHDVADVSYGHWVRPDGSTDLFALGRHDMLDRVKAALDPASAATWGKGESDLPGDRP